MKTLLVIAEHPALAEGIRAALSPEQCRVVHRTTLEDAEPLLVHGLVQICVVDLELSKVQGIWLLEKLHKCAPRCPVIVYAGPGVQDWEEEAYLAGAVHVLRKPVRSRMLSELVDRLLAPALPPQAMALPTLPAEVSHPPAPAAAVPASSTQALGVLRDFSAVLTHSLDAEGMLRQFLLLLREILGVNRAAIFLRIPASTFSRANENEERRLRAVCALGLAPGLLQHFELSLEGGIGGQLLRLGRILRRNSEEARADGESQKEFEVLGVQVAVPILDRETLLGVAVFDGRITGEPLANPELELVFHLLEQVGLAIKNIWLHDQLSANHGMLAEILRELSDACVVVGGDLAILHANKMAKRCFGRASERRGGDLEFSDLPQALGTKIYQVLKTGAAISNLRFEPEDAAQAVYNVNIVPFQRQASGLPASALLLVEDLTESEQLKTLEVETSNLRLVRQMADRLAAEVGNAMTPLSAHQQLLAEKWKDPEFRASLDTALAEGVKRVTRLASQMKFLARDALLKPEPIQLGPLLEEAYQEACKYQPSKTSMLRQDAPLKPVIIHGDRAALKHALTEVMLNALQANPADPKIGVRLNADTNGSGKPALKIEVQDNGSGFSPEAAQNAAKPFYTTRVVGVGLGLTVTSKILETHRGKLEIPPPKPGQTGVVRICLPLETTDAQTAHAT